MKSNYSSFMKFFWKLSAYAKAKQEYNKFCDCVETMERIADADFRYAPHEISKIDTFYTMDSMITCEIDHFLDMIAGEYIKEYHQDLPQEIDEAFMLSINSSSSEKLKEFYSKVNRVSERRKEDNFVFLE